MNNAVMYDLFNNKLDEFFKDLMTAFPDIKEFHKCKSGLMLMRNVNPKTPNEIFKNYVLSKYKAAILSKDESVFLREKEFDVYAQDGQDTKDHWIQFIHMLQRIWKTLDDKNKNIVWTYFHVLTVLSDKCV